MTIISRLDSPQGYKFSETIPTESCIQYNFGDLPFAVTVFAFPVEQGVITEWFVSSRKRIDNPQTALVMKLAFSISETDQWIIEGRINQIWDNYLVDLAYDSAMVGSAEIERLSKVNINRSVYSEFLYFHLYAHDRFSELLREAKMSKVEKTANWHQLLQSFGLKQTHQLIATYENKFVLPDEGGSKDVSTTSINQRLQVAKRRGLLIPVQPSPLREEQQQKPKDKEQYK